MENPKAQHLHVVVFDVPFPPDYGGAMDVYYRLKALKDSGIQLQLHVFDYGRGKPVELERLGDVHYYPRKRVLRYLFNRRPFIVTSRMNKELLERLKKDQHPILFEGIHTTWYLEDSDIRKRLTMVRMHNIEHDYYKGLMKHANGLKKLFFWWESIKLKKYEAIIQYATCVLAIKSSDAAHFERHNKHTLVVPASLPMEGMNATIEKTAPFALFHGNLSVTENERGAKWLINVLNSALTEDFPLIIAGKNPSDNLQKYADGKKVKIVKNPEEKEMNRLISSAHIHTLYSEVNSGTKLKFLSSLSANGHVLVNSGISGDVEKNEHFFSAESPESYLHTFRSLMHKEIREIDIQERRAWLENTFGIQNSVSIIKKALNNAPHSKAFP
jgi:hypothetical protein